MRFGLLCSARSPSRARPQIPGAGFREWLELNVEAERLGAHSTFLVEHHFSGWGQVSSALTLLACLAMRTTTLRLGTGVLALPLHHPVLLAEQAATVDVISGGRLDLGVGRGYRHPEFTGFGIAPGEAAPRFWESIEVIRGAWTSPSRFSHHGRFWHLDDLFVEPTPAQAPHPPLWMAAGSPESVAGAASAGLNLILDQYASPAQIEDRIALYRRRSRRGPDSAMKVAVARHLHVADTAAEAAAARDRLRADTERILSVARDPARPDSGSHVLAHQGPGAADAHALLGSPDRLTEGLAEIQQAGATEVLLIIDNDISQLRRVFTEVVPRVPPAPVPG
jgi:alkanesulfonate monooxygenase SsuD/methylene tetrahydromethanopterin reductase-like flavin-dependent oxidoreductase (luciferase family)